MPRTHKLGVKLPEDMKVFHDMSACPPASLPKKPNDVNELLKMLVEKERCAGRDLTGAPDQAPHAKTC